MLWSKKPKSLSHEQKRAAEYTTREEFCAIFDQGMESLYTLALMLTGEQEKAERCFTEALDQCLGAKVFHGWERSWTRLAVVDRAIRLIKPLQARRLESDNIENLRDLPGLCGEGQQILRLNAFERFVFVLSVLERYSLRDCAILLKCGLREVREARQRAIETIGNRAPQIVPATMSAVTVPQQI